jgi:hypothetical protein
MNLRADNDVPEDRELAALLRRTRTPAPPSGLFERAVDYALVEQERMRALRRSQTRWLAGGIGAAAAAALVLWVSGAVPPAPGNSEPGLPTVSMNLSEPETVRLVFAAETALEDATMTVTLPDGIELEGFPGEHEIRWETSLAEGRNLLPLTLIAKTPGGGEMRARLEHDTRDRVFRVRIDVS